MECAFFEFRSWKIICINQNTYKPGRKMRPIINTVSTPQSNLSKFLVNKLSSLNEPKDFSVKFSIELINAIKDKKMAKDELLVIVAYRVLFSKRTS